MQQVGYIIIKATPDLFKKRQIIIMHFLNFTIKWGSEHIILKT